MWETVHFLLVFSFILADMHMQLIACDSCFIGLHSAWAWMQDAFVSGVKPIAIALAQKMVGFGLYSLPLLSSSVAAYDDSCIVILPECRRHVFPLLIVGGGDDGSSKRRAPPTDSPGQCLFRLLSILEALFHLLLMSTGLRGIYIFSNTKNARNNASLY